LAEALDFKQAMRSYEANLNIMESQDAMDKATLSILNKR
jgi:flagellar basal-body rod protein FlgC